MNPTEREAGRPAVAWIGPIDDECRSAIGRYAELRVDPKPAANAAGEWQPALIVAAENVPGEIAAADWTSMRLCWPAAAWLRVVGPWCEGELRSWPPAIAALRVKRHEAAAWLARQLETLRGGRCPAWGLPATLTEDERLLQTSPAPEDAPPANGRAAILGRDAALVQWLADVCRRQGRATEIFGDGNAGPIEPAFTAADLILWQVPVEPSGIEAQCRALRTNFADARIVAITGFPRPDLVERMRSSQIEVVSIPADLERFRAVFRPSA